MPDNRNGEVTIEMVLIPLQNLTQYIQSFLVLTHSPQNQSVVKQSHDFEPNPINFA
jgi:hypothetical protein